MKLFLGLDSSTQSLSAVVIDLDTGAPVKAMSLNFGKEFPEFSCPQGFLPHTDPLVRQADPLLWVAALDRLCARLRKEGVPLEQIQGISGSGQQHGTIYLDAAFATGKVAYDPAADLISAIRPHLTRPTAPIWMDSSTSAECAEIAKAAGGAELVRKLSGSPPIERFSGPQIRKFYKEDPRAYERTGVIHLVSSFMASVLAGTSVGIDFGDGAGMNLLDLATGTWHTRLLNATAPGLKKKLPPAAASATVLAPVSSYFVQKYGFRAGTPVVAWSGDNPCSLIGVGAWEPGTAVISLGTSHTFFAAMRTPLVDPAGFGHVYGNPAGGFMSLICFKNGALALEQVRDDFHLDWSKVESLLAATPAGNNGNMILPYFVPEITPVVLDAKPVYEGTPAFREGRDAGAMVRAVVESQAIRLRLYSGWMGKPPAVVRVTGGASANRSLCQTLADVFSARVERLTTGNSAALGAAIMAAQAVSKVSWLELTQAFCKAIPDGDLEPVPDNVATYARAIPAFEAFVARHAGAGKQ